MKYHIFTMGGSAGGERVHGEQGSDSDDWYRQFQ